MLSEWSPPPGVLRLSPRTRVAGEFGARLRIELQLATQYRDVEARVFADGLLEVLDRPQELVDGEQGAQRQSVLCTDGDYLCAN